MTPNANLIPLLAAVALVTGQARAETLADTLQLAYRGNPDLAYQRAQVAAAAAGVDAARAPGLPQATFTSSAGETQINLKYGGGSAADTSQSQTDSALQLGVSQALYAGGRISQETRRAKANAQASEFDLRQTEQLVLGQAITAYADILRDEAILANRLENIEALRKQSTGVQARFREGEVTRTDIAQTEARLAQARSGAEAARANLAVSRAAYARIVGQAPGTLAPAPPLPGLPTSAEEAEAIALRNAPTIKAAESRTTAAEAAIRRAKAERMPYLSLDASADRANNRYSIGANGLAGAIQQQDSYGVRLNLRVPLFQGGAVDAGVRQAEAAERSALASQDSSERLTREGAANAWNRMQAADAIIESSRQQVEAADTAYRGGEYELNAGLRSTFDVLDLQQDVLSARISLATAQRDAYVARMTLLQAIGRLTLADLALDSALAAASVPAPASSSRPPGASLGKPSAPAAMNDRKTAVGALAATPQPPPAAPVLRPAVSESQVEASSPVAKASSGATPAHAAATPRPSPVASVVQAVATSAPSAACAVQAGAFPDGVNAARAKMELEALFPAAPAQWSVQTAKVEGRTTYRVLAASFADRSAADAFCRRLGAAGRACFLRGARCSPGKAQVAAIATTKR